MKIALGTTSEGKRKYLEEVLKDVGVSASIESVEVESGISEQPITSLETKRGSINRAKKALLRLGEADFGLGIEVGYHPNKDGNYEMFCWASSVDRAGKVLSKRSHKIVLPEFHQQVLKENKYLSDYVRVFLSENSDPVSTYIGVMIRDREPFIKTAILSVLAYHLRY